MTIFPTLQGKWAEANFNEEAKKFADMLPKENKDCTPEESTRLVDLWHQINKVDYSFGGYLEDRSFLFRNKYHAQRGTFIHLGVDYNVPAGTPVTVPCPATVVDRWIDKDQEGGWGGRVVLFLPWSNYYMIYAHLAAEGLPMPGDHLGNAWGRTEVGLVGAEHENGGWFPHLHIQLVSGDYLKSHDVREFDGYAKMYDGIERDFPNPELAVGRPI